MHTHLECDHEVEEEHHVDDAVDDSLLEGDEQEHARTHKDPVLTQHVPQPPT